MDLKYQTQVIRLGSKCLYPLSHPLALDVLRQGLAKFPKLLVTYSVAQARLEFAISLLQPLASVFVHLQRFVIHCFLLNTETEVSVWLLRQDPGRGSQQRSHYAFVPGGRGV